MSCTPNSSVIPVFHSLPTPCCHPFWIPLCLLAGDVVSLCGSVLIAGWSKHLRVEGVELGGYLRLWPFLPAFLLLYLSAGLYSCLAFSAPEELRRATLCSSLGFVLLSILTLPVRGATSYIQPTLIVAILLSIIFVPLSRAAIRKLFGAKEWWGYPAVLFGPREKVIALSEILQKNPGLGLKPIAHVHDHSDGGKHSIQGLVTDKGDELSALIDVRPGMYAVIISDSSRTTTDTLHCDWHKFSHVLVIPDLQPLEANLWISPRAVGGFLGLEMKRKLLQRPHLAAKRMLDLTLAGVVALLAAPALMFIAMCVRLSSKGSVFYRQERIGRHGEKFRAYKFRTMYANSDELLEKALAERPVLRTEWEETRKLKNDPRVTPIGRFMRGTSLDELPQLWNVLKGEMSLVGPRPIVAAEIPLYGDSFSLYMSVAGGVTGLWQVSGRSDTSYQDRVSLDEYYVRNWSVWLDLYILCRTVSTVLSRKGAY